MEVPIEFHRNGPWELPERWVWARARDFAYIVGGATPKNAGDESNFDPDGAPWITPADLSGYLAPHISRGARSLSKKGSANCSARTLPAGSLLISSRAPVGYCAVASNEVTTNQGFKSLVFKAPMCSEFFRYYVIFNRKYFIENASGTTFKELSGETMSELLFPIAPLPEQRRIVARIDELFTEIADGEAALAQARDDLDTWRRALLKAAVTGELTREWRESTNLTDTGSDLLQSARAKRDDAGVSTKRSRVKVIPPSEEIRLPEIPNSWAWGQLGDFLYDIEAGLNVKAEGRPPHEGETGIVKISAVTWDEFDENESKALPPEFEADERIIIRPGDFLISRANTLELVAAPVIVKSCERRLVLSDKVLRLRLVEGFDRWIELCLKSPVGRLQIEHYASGNQLSMRNITQENIARIAIPIPPKSEMEHAVELHARSREHAEDGSVAISDSARTAKSLRQSVLKGAFAGQLVQQESRDEPADRLLARLTEQGDTTPPAHRRSRARRAALAAE